MSLSVTIMLTKLKKCLMMDHVNRESISNCMKRKKVIMTIIIIIISFSHILQLFQFFNVMVNSFSKYSYQHVLFATVFLFPNIKIIKYFTLNIHHYKRKHKFKLQYPTYMVKLSIPRLNNEMSTNDAKKCDKCSLNQHTLFRIEKKSYSILLS